MIRSAPSRPVAYLGALAIAATTTIESALCVPARWGGENNVIASDSSFRDISCGGTGQIMCCHPPVTYVPINELRLDRSLTAGYGGDDSNSSSSSRSRQIKRSPVYRRVCPAAQMHSTDAQATGGFALGCPDSWLPVGRLRPVNKRAVEAYEPSLSVPRVRSQILPAICYRIPGSAAYGLHSSSSSSSRRLQNGSMHGIVSGRERVCRRWIYIRDAAITHYHSCSS